MTLPMCSNFFSFISDVLGSVVGLRNCMMRINKIFGPIVLSHKSSSEMSASGYVTLLIRSVESSPSLSVTSVVEFCGRESTGA